jgi:hypothetical protein
MFFMETRYFENSEMLTDEEAAMIDSLKCACCGDEIDSNGILAPDESCGYCKDCRVGIFEKPGYFDNKEPAWLCGNCETLSNIIEHAESGALKCSVCGYVDGEKLFTVHSLFF